jgi:aspartate/methionine/tyrosine aminotransferase
VAGDQVVCDLVPHVAESVLRVPNSRIRELAEMAMAMDGDVLRLYFGESNLPTPQFIKDAATEALRAGWTFYTENAGLPTLRHAIAEQYRRLHGVELDPATELIVSASGIQALALGIRCVLDPGDEAICLTPAWPNGAAISQLANATPVEVPHVLDGERYVVDFDALEAAVTPRTRLLIYTSPSNPLGWTATEEEQDLLLDFARRHGLWLLADEVYERLFYRVGEPGAPAPSLLRKATRDDAVLVAQSFSKTYCMTGWRLGWLVCRGDVGVKAGPLNEFFVSHATSFIQKAGEVALDQGEDWVRGQVRELRANRDLCLAALRSMPGVTIPDPDGAFYLFPRIEGLEDSFEFCRRLLVESRVGLAPGVAFGAGGEGSVRLCYASEQRILETALERLDAFLRSGQHLA